MIWFGIRFQINKWSIYFKSSDAQILFFYFKYILVCITTCQWIFIKKKKSQFYHRLHLYNFWLIEYKLDFYNKYITRTGAAIKKVKYGHEFVDWFKNESRVRIPNNQDIINICRECMKNYDKRGNQSKKFYMFIFVFYKTRK